MLNVIANTIDGGIFATLDKFIIFGFLDAFGIIEPLGFTENNPENMENAIELLIQEYSWYGVFFE